MGFLSGKRPAAFASSWIKVATLGLFISFALQVANCELEPTESQCRPYIEKALKQHSVDAEETREDEPPISIEQDENVPTDELTETIEELKVGENEDLKNEELLRGDGEVEQSTSETKEEEVEEDIEDEAKEEEVEDLQEDGENEEETINKDDEETRYERTEDEKEAEEVEETDVTMDKDEAKEEEQVTETEDLGDESENKGVEVDERDETVDEDEDKREEEKAEAEQMAEETEDKVMGADGMENEEKEREDNDQEQQQDDENEDVEADEEVVGDAVVGEEMLDREVVENVQDSDRGGIVQSAEIEVEAQESEKTAEKEKYEEIGSQPEPTHAEVEESEISSREENISKLEVDVDVAETSDDGSLKVETEEKENEEPPEDADTEGAEVSEEGEHESTPEEDLTKEVIIPENLRPRDHITKILRLDEDSVETESVLKKAIDSTLKNLKSLYDSAIKPLEMLYKYRDLSNRHFGDPEIFSKPLILFMGPWSGGKSSTINYLLDNEFTEMSLRTGAEPSPAYFNILMHGEEEEILDGTQLAADWTFSGLQKFGQSLLDRLKGYKLPNRLLEKVNIVEIPGILEIRKQVQRLFPFNDACQWFIDRADIIFLVYDPSKLDVGPETEAILDQLKGREYQTRIILNKADQVKPEELMRVQGTLIWNISPLMSSSEPPIMYSTSLWSLPYENGAPTRLLLAQERAFLRDLREAIDKRVDNKIASARRFAVRVRNHAKMVDCYLTTYYNHKTFFGNKKKISDDIIENPQKYHIYEGLSTLTNISRYDLPDPDVYRDFFKLNALYDFKKLSDTCTYFRGCPINTLDVAIAYDLPELVGKYKKAVEASKVQTSQKTNS